MDKKNTKKTKEVERPPWRAVVSPAVKLDKNSLLKARLLDASRRITKASKNPSVGLQTDITPTKLVKEVSLGIQDDLIHFKDQECLTDGTITLKDKTGNLILTHSVSQMTDAIIYIDSETQTAMPCSNIAFDRFIKKKPGSSKNSNIKKMNNNYREFAEGNKNAYKKTTLYNDFNDLNSNEKFQNESSKNSCTIRKKDVIPDIDSDSMSESENNTKTNYKTESFQTRNHWLNIDFSSDDEYPQLPRTTVSDGVHSLTDFKDIILGQRLSKMKLSPIPQRHRRPNMKRVAWSGAEYRLVSNLVTEANALIEMFDQVAMLLGPDIKLNELPQVNQYKLPPFKMDSVLTNSCNVLEEKINQIKPIKFANLQIKPNEIAKNTY